MAKKSEQPKWPNGLTYIGGGAYYPGLPARNLSAIETVALAELLGELEAAGTLAQLYIETTASTVEGETNA